MHSQSFLHACEPQMQETFSLLVWWHWKFRTSWWHGNNKLSLVCGFYFRHVFKVTKFTAFKFARKFKVFKWQAYLILMYAYVNWIPAQFFILSFSCCSIILKLNLKGLSLTYGSLWKRQSICMQDYSSSNLSILTDYYQSIYWNEEKHV